MNTSEPVKIDPRVAILIKKEVFYVYSIDYFHSHVIEAKNAMEAMREFQRVHTQYTTLSGIRAIPFRDLAQEGSTLVDTLRIIHEDIDLFASTCIHQKTSEKELIKKARELVSSIRTITHIYTKTRPY